MKDLKAIHIHRYLEVVFTVRLSTTGELDRIKGNVPIAVTGQTVKDGYLPF